MTNLTIKYSLTLRELARELVADLNPAPLPPHLDETILVQSRGMRDWLQLELARRTPIAASLAMPFPAAFFTRICTLLLPDSGPATPFGAITGTGAFGREVLIWRIFALLPQLRHSAYKPLKTYLDDDFADRLTYQLAGRIAGRFDDYQLFRPELLDKWQNPSASTSLPHEEWQRHLWNKLCETSPKDEKPLSDLLAALASQLRKNHPADLLADHLPRLNLFGITTLPPRFLEILHLLAQHIPVNIYATTPSTEFWGDIRSTWEIAKKSKTATGAAAATEHLQEGNPLLANLGRVGRDFFNLLLDLDESGQAMLEIERTTPFPQTALGTIQSDIATLQNRGLNRPDPPVDLEDTDRSLQIHSCHSPRRELETLRDLILESLGEMDDLRPAEILVMVPDIDQYAPFIQATFGVNEAGLPAIPFRIRDRSRRSGGSQIQALLRLFEIAGGRFTVNEIFDLLQFPSVRRTFNINENDLPALQHLVKTTKISWGVDGVDRANRFANHPFTEGSWEQGLKRILLGSAMGTLAEPVTDILPLCGDTAGRNELIGHFIHFCRSVFARLEDMTKPRRPRDWQEFLAETVAQFFAPVDSKEEEALADIQATIAQFGDITASAGVAQELSFTLIHEHFAQLFSEPTSGQLFLDGSITFASFKPMRSLPFRLVCIAGLNDGQFPRSDSPLAFDLIATKGKLGDRSLRNDDRFLFLETIMSAEERLILLYQGQSAKDNSPRPASVCLDELLEYTDHAFTTKNGKKPRELLIRKHRLHYTSSAYYKPNDSGLFSYSLENAQAAQSHQERPNEPFFPNRAKTPVFARIAPATSPGETIKLADLTSFWLNPAKFLCRSALGFTLPWAEEKTPEYEIFSLGPLDEFTLKNELVSRIYKKGSLPPLLSELKRARLSGWLPVGRQGEEVFYKCFNEACQLVQTALAFGKPQAEVIEITVLDRKISGSFERLTPEGCIFFEPRKEAKAKDLLKAWITHLGLNIKRLEMNQSGLPTSSLHLDKNVTFPPVTDLGWAKRTLATLVKGYLVGTCRPLPFFPKTSLNLCEETTLDNLVTAAGEAWVGNSYQGIPGDRDEEHVQLCFRGRNPLTEYPLNRKSLLWARAIWLPLLEVKQ